MEDEFAACDSAVQGVSIAEVAGDTLYIKFMDLACRAAQCADFVAAIEQELCDVPTEEAACSRN
jgi:hypothetical protein